MRKSIVTIRKPKRTMLESCDFIPDVGHGRPREAGVDGEALQQAGPEVGDAECDELLVGVHLVVVLGRERPRRGHRLREADQRQRDGVRQQVDHVAEPDAGDGQ